MVLLSQVFISVVIGILLPLRFIPSALFLSVVTIPVLALPFSSINTVIYPGLSIVSVYWLKVIVGHMRTEEFSFKFYPAQISFILYLAVLTLTSTDFLRSLGFSFSLILMCFLWHSIYLSKDIADLLLRTWLRTLWVIGPLGVLESITKTNFIFGKLPFYSDLQIWSDYRITVTFSHPIFAGTFFASSSILLFTMLLENKKIIWWKIIILNTFCIVNLFYTYTRGAYIAWLAGLVFIAFRKIIRGENVGVYSLLILIATFISTVLAPYIPRANTIEGGSSILSRLSSFNLAWDLMRGNLFGHGPGLGQDTLTEDTQSKLILESSVLQVGLGIGWVGLAIMVVAFLETLIVAQRSYTSQYLPVMVCCIICILSYNFIEGYKYAHFFIGAILILLHNGKIPGVGVRRK